MHQTRLALLLCLTLALIFLPGCAIKEAAGNANDVLLWTKDKLAGVDEKIQGAYSYVDGKVDEAKADLAAKGAPVGDGATFEDVKNWAFSNPLQALGSGGSLATWMGYLLVKGRRRKKVVETLVAVVEDLDDVTASAVKDAIGARVGSIPNGFAKVIDQAKAANLKS